MRSPARKRFSVNRSRCTTFELALVLIADL